MSAAASDTAAAQPQGSPTPAPISDTVVHGRGRHHPPPSTAAPFALGRRLGLHPGVTRLNFITFLAHCSASILFLVFLNASQPFVIQQRSSPAVGAGSGTRATPSAGGSGGSGGSGGNAGTGALSGTLIFSDELLSTFLAPLWGAAADVAGFSAVTPVGYLFVGFGLLAFTIPRQPWPGLLFARLLFAVGGSGVTAMLSGILTAFSHGGQQERGPAPSSLARHGQVGEDGPADDLAGSDSLEPGAAASGNPESDTKSRHGRLASIAGVFTGTGALIAVFGLLRLPQALAGYFDQRMSEPSQDGGKGGTGGGTTDLAIRRATTATFVIAAALAFLVAVVTALGLRSPEDRPVGLPRATRRRGAGRDAGDGDYAADDDDDDDGGYGAMLDSTITILSDSREARRSRLRQRQQRRERTSWSGIVKRSLADFGRSAAGGFRLVGPVRSDPTSTTSHDGGRRKEHWRLRSASAVELRMAYLGGALARACTIGTTAFLPLIISQHYYTSGLCHSLPSPDPHAPLPPDDVKRLCRQAFTATAILGGTIQLTALLLSPLIGLLCDWTSPTATLGVTSAFSAGGFLLLATGSGGLKGDPNTGTEVADPLSTLSILAAMAIGFGQIGAIVASLSGCARARSLLLQSEAAAAGEEEEEEDEGNADVRGNRSTRGAGGREERSESQGLLVASRRQQRRAARRTGAARKVGDAVRSSAIGSAGSIAGAYTCCGSIAILVISKTGGWLFDLFAPAPFLLIAGCSAFVSLVALATTVLAHLLARRRL